MDPMSPPMLTADVADALGLSVSRVVQLDDQLRPLRTPRGVRVYSRDVVDFEVGRRLARAA